MKRFFVFLSIATLLFAGCNEKAQNSDIDRNDSLCSTKEENETQFMINESVSEENLSDTTETQGDMVDIARFFTSEEFDAIRNSYVKQLRYQYWNVWLSGFLTEMPSSAWGGRDKKYIELMPSDKERSENMDVIYRVLSKKYPIFKPVPKELFEEKMKSVFGIDVNNTSVCNGLFYTNHDIDEESFYSIYIDLRNHIITLGNLPLLFKEEIDWDEFNKKLENIDQESIAYYDAKERLYEEYLNESLQKKYTLYCSKIQLEYLFHVNNYVFYENQASLSWLLANYEKTDQSFTSILFDFFNYDKNPRINRINMDYDISKGFPLIPNDYEHIFGELTSCPQTQYYNHFQFKVRTGLMQYVVDNCYDDEDLDDCGLKKDKYICVMEDCFDYLFKFVLQGDKYKESENCHYYQVCAYLAYYLQKAYDSYLSHNDGEPRCWHNALANNLYQDLRNNDGRFEKYVRDNNYFNLEGFDKIMEDAHEQAMRD